MREQQTWFVRTDLAKLHQRKCKGFEGWDCGGHGVSKEWCSICEYTVGDGPGDHAKEGPRDNW